MAAREHRKKKRPAKYRSELLDAVDNEIISKGYSKDEDREDEKQRCRRVGWRSLIFPIAIRLMRCCWNG